MARFPITLADLTDPAGARDRQLKADKLTLNAEIAGATLYQQERHHSDKMGLEGARLDQNERHHSDDMTLAYSKLDYEREKDERDRDAAKQKAMIEQCGSMSLERLRHSNAVGLVNAQVSADISKRARSLPYDYAQSVLKRGEDSDHALSQALGNILTAKVQGKISEHLADQTERHRANERSHEIVMACLQSRLRKDELTHEEATRFAVRMIERANSAPTPPTPEEVESWIEALKGRGAF